MIGASKILTVSYGTFSCTLEGFDDPFNTMKAIAEYFRDLAAEDRYFGAEPPTPDAAMLHRIAEREVQRRVEAKIQENGVILRAGAEDAPVAAPVPAAPVAAPAPALDAAPAAVESAAERLRRLRAGAVAPAAVAAVAAPAAASEWEEDLPDVAAALPQFDSFSALDEAAPVSAAFPEAGLADDAADEDETEESPLPAAALLDEAEDDLTDEDDLSAVEDLLAEDAAPAVADVELAEEVVLDEAEADAEELLASLNVEAPAEPEAPAPESDFAEVDAEALIAAMADPLPEDAPATDDLDAEAAEDLLPETAGDDSYEDEDEGLLAALADDLNADAPAADDADDLDDEMLADADLSDEAELLADDLADDVADDELLADDLSDDDLAGEEEDLRAALTGESDAPAPSYMDEAEDMASAAAALADMTDAEDVAEAAPAPAATPTSERLQRARARVIRIRRSDAAPAPAPAPAPAADAPRASVLSPEAEAALQAELAALSAEFGGDDDAAPLADNLAEVAAENAPAAVQSEAAADTPETEAADPAEGPGPRRILDAQADEDAAVSRLMAQANSAMDGEDTRRRQSALAHLKAAVAATEAERQITGAAPGAGAPREDRYRADLEKVVRPAQADAQPGERLSPLVLVSEQRIDRPRSAPAATLTVAASGPAPAAAAPVAAPAAAPAQPARVMPVRPRRVTSGATAAGAASAMAHDDAEDDLIGAEDEALAQDDDGDSDGGNIFADGESFADFADRLGATRLPDLIEAAAVYCATVLNRPEFSRPLILRQIAGLPGGAGASREDSLRSFGKLMRAGRISKVRAGHFAVTDASPYLAEARRIAG